MRRYGWKFGIRWDKNISEFQHSCFDSWSQSRRLVSQACLYNTNNTRSSLGRTILVRTIFSYNNGLSARLTFMFPACLHGVLRREAEWSYTRDLRDWHRLDWVFWRETFRAYYCRARSMIQEPIRAYVLVIRTVAMLHKHKRSGTWLRN